MFSAPQCHSQDRVIPKTVSFPKTASFREPLPLPVGEQFQYRGGGLFDRSSRDVELRPI
jgi:hypothetical protein